MLSERLEAAGAFCDRLLHPSVTEDAEGGRQRRLLQVLLLAPGVILPGAVQILTQLHHSPHAIASVAAIFAVMMAPLLGLVATGRGRLMEAATLIAGTVAVAALVALGGGIGSAYTALLAALMIEPVWVARRRQAAVAGLGAAFVAGALAVLFSTALPLQAEPTAWSWLAPLAYGLFLVARLVAGGEARDEKPVSAGADAVVAATGSIILRLRANGDVCAATAQTRVAMGIEPEMLLGSGLFERVLVSDRVAYLSALADVRDGRSMRSVRLRVRVPGTYNSVPAAVYRSFVADMAADQDGEILMVLRDDEALARLEAEVVEARKDAREAVEMRDRLLASVSHELRTPLNAIAGFSDVLTNELFGPFANGKQREYVTLINEASCHLLNVVNTILDVSKIKAGTYVGDVEEFDLGEAARLSMAIVAREASSKPVRLELDVDQAIGTVRCDRRALQQILINLLSNAVKFTEEGYVRLTARKQGKRLFLTVADSGIGIEPQDLSRLGKPFTQIRNEHASKGTGLGLALVKGLVEACGGSLSIDSAPGVGTKVHVSLPVGETVVSVLERENGAKSSVEWNEIPLRKTA